MRYFRYGLIAVLGIVLVVIAVANRDPVVFRFLPVSAAQTFGGSWAVQLPMFVILLGGITIGVLVGFVWEWFREHGHRKRARVKSKEAAKLEQEVVQLRRETGRPNGKKDEIVALLETGNGKR
ncbi:MULTISPECIES: LapA family protein [unclassified Haematobacter]|uniref:LapA family protein n=1 Tax=unclassified Haematobacter TaxID=2640585 RepID=UPI0025BE5141|nr:MULTISPECIES: LapA family protein [unclassified Haematobacter]